MSPHPRNNHKHTFVKEMCPSVIKISLKKTSKPSSNSNSSQCLKGASQVKGKRSVRQSRPPTKRLIAMNDNDVSDEEVCHAADGPRLKWSGRTN